MKFMMQSCIMAAGMVCDGGSKMLEGFKSPLDATAYKKCLDAGMEFAGLLTPSEFGTDSLFCESEDKDTAVDAILDGKCDVVLCNDVYGKLVRLAAKNGLVFIQPAYGTVSRFGIMQTVSSMDRIGILCKNAEDGIKVLSTISGKDEKDGSMFDVKEYNYSADFDAKVSAIDFADADMKYFELLPAVFYALASAELCNNTNRYDGVKFGHRAENINGINDLYLKSRTEGLGKDIQIASMVGCMVLAKENYEKWYYKAMQIRRMVRDHYTEILTKNDVLVLPCECECGDKFKQTAFYALAPLCGFASVSARLGGKNAQLICKRGKENAMFAMLKEG